MRKLFSVITFFLFSAAPLLAPKSDKTCQADLHSLICVLDKPAFISEMTLNGQNFIPEELAKIIRTFAKEPRGYLSPALLSRLIDKIETFFAEQRSQFKMQGYKLNLQTNPKAEFNGHFFPRSLQLDMAFCVSMYMLGVLIALSKSHGCNTNEVQKQLEELITQESEWYNFYNPERPGFFDASYELVLRQANARQLSDESSTDASSEDEK